MKVIERKASETPTLSLRIFEAESFDATIFVYLNEKKNVISMNYHWGTKVIDPNYMNFNGKGDTTKLYKVLRQLHGEHSTKLFDMVIASHSVYHNKDLKIAELETELAEERLKNKRLEKKIKKITKLADW